MLKKIFIALGILIALTIGLILSGGFTKLAQMKLEMDCPTGSHDENCLSRYRAGGHLAVMQGDIEAARRYYTQAANGGDEAAMFHLGWMHHLEAMKDVSLLARSGAIPAPKRSGAPEKAMANRSENERLALMWYERSAKAGFAPAMVNFAEMKLQGIGTTRDVDTALKWMHRAAEAGNPVAYMNLVTIYATGNSVPANPEMVRKWEIWEAKDFDPRDIASPTLERTYTGGDMLPVDKAKLVRAAAAEDGFFKLTYSAMQPDSRLPTFRETQIHRKRDSTTRIYNEE